MWKQVAASSSVVVPLARRLLAVRTRVRPPCSWKEWETLLAAVSWPEQGHIRWTFFMSPWREDRFGAFPVDRRGRIDRFIQVRRSDTQHFDPHFGIDGPFRIPKQMATAAVGDWSVSVVEPLPRFHRAPRLDAMALSEISAEIGRVIEPVLKRPAGAPGEWRPVHGDLTPWNLRQGRDRALWLLDWEHAAWGPAGSDELHYRLAEESVSGGAPTEIANRVHAVLPSLSTEAAAFWLDHTAFAPRHAPPDSSQGRRTDVARVNDVIEALQILSRG